MHTRDVLLWKFLAIFLSFKLGLRNSSSELSRPTGLSLVFFSFTMYPHDCNQFHLTQLTLQIYGPGLTTIHQSYQTTPHMTNTPVSMWCVAALVDIVLQVGWSCAVFLMDFGGGRGTSGSGCLVCQLSSLGIYTPYLHMATSEMWCWSGGRGI